MIKYTTRDIVAILRLFGLATDQTGQRDISYVQSRAPADHSTIVAFVYQKNHYYIIHDDEIEDNESTARLSVAAAYGVTIWDRSCGTLKKQILPRMVCHTKEKKYISTKRPNHYAPRCPGVSTPPRAFAQQLAKAHQGWPRASEWLCGVHATH